jgi:hypothetical protein
MLDTDSIRTDYYNSREYAHLMLSDNEYYKRYPKTTDLIYGVIKEPIPATTSMPNYDDSVVCHVSSKHGSRSDDGSTFVLTIGSNILYGKSVSRLTPIQIYCPNVFPNVKAVYATFTLAENADPAVTMTVPVNQYTSATLAIALTTEVQLTFPDVSFTVDSATGKFVMSNADAADTYTATFTLDNMGHVLGVDGSVTAPALGSVTMPYIPNLAGERLVHIKSEKLGHSNMLSSKSGNPEDIVFTIPLHDVQYGGMGCWQPGDHILGDQDFKWDLHIDTFSVTLLDENLDRLELPINYSLELQFKVYHAD